ncbi:MAG: hypothetical protein J7L73_08630 [Anaerolineales bacterium]|nr:hypothetical protein [Anaerolineales bacterium]
MKKRLLTVISIGVITLGVLFIAYHQRLFVQADAASPKPQMSSEEIIQEVESLVNQWSSPLLQGNSWLHVEEKHLRGMENVGNLPSGQPIPMNYINNAWYLLNSEGRVIKSVILMETLDGEVVQESVFNGKQWVNNTTGDIIEREPFRLHLDFGFSEDIADGTEVYDALSAQEVIIDGNSALRVFARDDFGGAIQPAGIQETIISIETRATFDKENGAMLSLETIGIGINGEEYTLETTTFLTLERSNPPAEISTLLNKRSK